MKPSSERLFMMAAGLCVMAVAAAIAFQMITERKRSAAVARMKSSVAATQQRAAAGPPVTSAEGGKPDRSGPTRSAPAKASESVAAFAALFPKVRALEDDKRWETFYEEVLLKKDARDWTIDEQAAAKNFTDEARPLIQEIRRLANLGGPAIELDYSKGGAIELPHLAPLRTCARLLGIDADVQAQQGNYEEAAEDILASFKLGNAIKDEPILISQLFRCAMDGITYAGVQEALPQDGLDPELARRVIETAGRAEAHQNFAESFTLEAMIGLEHFERFRDGNTESLLYHDRTQSMLDIWGVLPENRAGQRIFVTAYSSVIVRPWLNMDETTYSETIPRIQEAAQLPYDQALPVMQQIEQDIADLPHTRVLTRTLLPDLTRRIAAQARDEAFLALTRVGLALELYHAQNGAYPTSLDAIAPILGGHVPVDPFTGQPLGYKPSGQSFVLYSVGQDLVDDGGKPGYNDGGGLDYRTGDIVWRAQPKADTGSAGQSKRLSV
ncbi:MAG: hypothetical protein HZB26_01435 [Candidatus Hydrogenedentes bacterium]|nr:hypothetical protein [Candidatus Hydrogenedentota bacterium]